MRFGVIGDRRSGTVLFGMTFIRAQNVATMVFYGYLVNT